MDHLDVLMVFPPGGILQEAIFKHNLGSGYIIGYLRKNGYTIEQFITKKPLNVKECVKQIYRKNPKIIGFTVYNSNYMQSVLISNEIKKINSKSIVVFGGPTATVQDEEILDNTNSVDICVRGEGEEVLLILLSKLIEENFELDRVDLYKIKGITFRKDNRIIKNDDSNILLSHQSDKNYLDNYPSPYLTGIIPISEAFSTGIITARGCNQNCVYCNCAVMSKKRLFFHSIERVIDELIYIDNSKDHTGPIPIYDDTFTVIPSRAKKICEIVHENDLKIKFSCVTRCDKISEDLLDLMKQAGLVSLGVSLESAVPRVLRTIGKVNPPQSNQNLEKEHEFINKVSHITAYAKSIGINHVFVSIMVGLPSETPEDIKTTLDFVKELHVDAYQHNFFKIFKGTPIYKNYENYGYKISPISKKNPVILNMNYPFDIYQVKLEQKSMDEIVGKFSDYNTLKLLTFHPNQKQRHNFFKNVIIYANRITISMVEWLQSNLSINGSIIQIYPDKRSFLKYENENRNTMFGEISPSLYFESYFLEKVNNYLRLISGRTLKFGEHIALPITLLPGSRFIDKRNQSIDDFFTVLCVEKETADSETIYDYLNAIDKNNVSLNTLIKQQTLPFFQNLCKWTQSTANCLTMETAIINEDGSIQICWFGDNIGNIHQKFSEIEENLNNLREKIKRKRNCRSCTVNKVCVKCLFTEPLPSINYCDLRRKGKTTNSTLLIDSYSIIKDLVFNPDFHTNY